MATFCFPRTSTLSSVPTLANSEATYLHGAIRWGEKVNAREGSHCCSDQCAGLLSRARRAHPIAMFFIRQGETAPEVTSPTCE